MPGNATQRPDNNGHSAYLPGGVEDKLDKYFDTSVFSQPVAYTFGNTGRTLPDVRGPVCAIWISRCSRASVTRSG